MSESDNKSDTHGSNRLNTDAVGRVIDDELVDFSLSELNHYKKRRESKDTNLYKNETSTRSNSIVLDIQVLSLILI